MSGIMVADDHGIVSRKTNLSRSMGGVALRKLTGVYSLILLLSVPPLFATTRPKTQPRKTHPVKHTETRQTQPSPQRIAEIQSALKARGYEPGETWEETREVCRRIAGEHEWQTDHAPDARVLILLGLAGPHADPAVAQLEGGRLDKDQRAEAARISVQNLALPQTTGSEVISKPAIHSERTRTPHARRLTASKRKMATNNKNRNLKSRQS